MASALGDGAGPRGSAERPSLRREIAQLRGQVARLEAEVRSLREALAVARRLRQRPW